MDENTRACIAYIAGTLVNRFSVKAVYDHTQSRFFNISGSVKRNYVEIFDHNRGGFIIGELTSLYDFYRNATISLSVKGNQVYGYDYGEGHGFDCVVKGKSVIVYQQEVAYSYSLSLKKLKSPPPITDLIESSPQILQQ